MDQLPVSPLKPAQMADLPVLSGLRIATGNSGTRYKNRDDVTLFVLPEGSSVAGVFTRSKCPSAPVDWCRQNLASGTARALLVNAGNANAFTGAVGMKGCEVTAGAVAEAVGCDLSDVMLSSTGVIGEPLEMDQIAAASRVLATEASEAPLTAAA
ncbi:MAG: bifunctional ornithine acetyltransferase/N-acetylglutamate synthase, partial [Alphaproteobacteria bacterium]